MRRTIETYVYYSLTGLFGLVVGALLMMSTPQPGSAAGVDPAMLAGQPVLAVATNSEFDMSEIHAKVGETVVLQLQNTDGPLHTFDIDELNVHAPMPLGQTGLAIFKPAKPGAYVFYCDAHFDRATGTGMHGTLVVES
jgi:plastocyanin